MIFIDHLAIFRHQYIAIERTIPGQRGKIFIEFACAVLCGSKQRKHKNNEINMQAYNRLLHRCVFEDEYRSNKRNTDGNKYNGPPDLLCLPSFAFSDLYL